MKIFFFIALFSSFSFSSTYAQWSLLSPQPLKGISRFSSSGGIVWGCGSKVLLMSEDFADTWKSTSPVPFTGQNSLVGFTLISADTAIAQCYEGLRGGAGAQFTAYLTSNRGKSWVE